MKKYHCINCFILLIDNKNLVGKMNLTSVIKRFFV